MPFQLTLQGCDEEFDSPAEVRGRIIESTLELTLAILRGGQIIDETENEDDEFHDPNEIHSIIASIEADTCLELLVGAETNGMLPAEYHE